MKATTAQSLLLYGSSGTYKTTSVVSFALYVKEKTGRSIRLISAETAGVEPLTPAIEAGLIDPLWLQLAQNPRVALRKLSRGCWLSPPPGMGWIEPAGQDWANVGGYAIEGLTSISELLRLDLQKKQAQAARPGDTGISGAGYMEDGEVFGVSSMGQYGAAQDDIMAMLKELPKATFSNSGGRVQYVMFTAHESKGKDEVDKGKAIYGPGTVGSALTNKIQKEVGTLLHAEEQSMLVQVGKEQRMVRTVRTYFESHPDAENPNILWQAKPRIPPTTLAVGAMRQRWPGGYFEPVPLDAPPPADPKSPACSLADFLRFQDELQKRAAAGLMARLAQFQATTAQTEE